MLSLVAMAALPMAGLADALVPEVGEGWQTETGDEVGLDDHGLLVSIGGSTITKKITLVPGTYSVNAGTSNNAVIKVEANGKTYKKGIQFTLEEEGEITVTLSAESKGNDFSVGDLALTLHYDFNAAQTYLRDMLNGAWNNLSRGDEADEWEKALNDEYSKQNGLLQLVFSIEDNGADAYKVYKEQELYRGVQNSKAYETVKAYVDEVDACVANKQAYNKAKDMAEDWQANKLAALQNTLDSAVDQKTKDFYTKDVEGLQTEVAKFLTELEEKYNGKEAVAYTEGKAEWAEGMPGNISELQAKIQAFDEVMQAVTKATDDKDGYNTKVAELIKDIDAEGRYKEILADVKETLAEDYKPVYEVEQFIKNKDNDPRDDKDANKQKVQEAQKKMQADYDLYKERLDRYTAAYVELDDFQERLNTVKEGMKDIGKTEYNDEISDIQKLLDAIDKKFQQGMEDNMDLPDWSETEVERRLSSLETDTQATLDNYNAWMRLNAEIGNLSNNLEEANTNVATYVSEDEAYTATNYWTVSEGIKTTIDVLENDVTAAYNDGKAVDFKENKAEQKRFNDIQKAIDNYDKKAKTARNNYNTVQNKLKNWQSALEKVRGIVDNPDVTMSDGTTTYRVALAEAEQTIADLQTGLEAALGLTDYDHADAMESLAATQKPNVLKTTKDSYEQDLQNYSENRALDAAVKLVDDVNALKAQVVEQRDSLQNKFGSISTTEAEDYGLRYSIIAQQLQDYENTLTGMQIVDATSITKDNAIDELKKLNGQLQKLYEIQNWIGSVNLEKIKEEVQANKSAYDTLNGNFATLKGEIEKINDFTATSGQFAEKSYNKDPNRSDEFETEESKLLDKWTTLTAGLNEALQNETVVTGKWQTKYEDFEKTVNEKIDAAKASTANYDAYNELLNKIRDTFYPKLNEDGTERGDLIDMEKEEVKAIATPENAGQQHFLGELDRYRTQLGTLEGTDGEIEQAYDARTCATGKAELLSEIESLESSIKGTSDLAQANEKKHNLLLDKETETLTLWNTVYDKLSGEDQSSQIMTWLDQLRDIKTLFDGTVGGVEDKFGKGAYSDADKYNTDVSTFDEYLQQIRDIKGNWEDPSGYLAAIIADNDARHKAFQEALSDARDAFNKAVISLAKFQNITDEELLVKFDEVIKANQTEKLYDYSEHFRDLQASEQTAYYDILAITSPAEGTGTPAVFDLHEDFRKKAEEYTADINDIYNRTTDALNATSKELLKDALDAAEQAVNVAEAAITGYHNEVKVNAFSDEKHDIQTGRNWLEDNYRELAVELANGFLAKVRGIGASVLDECEALAQKEYGVVEGELRVYNEKARQQLEDISVSVPEGDDTDYLQRYIDAYNQYISGEGGFIEIGNEAMVQNNMFSDEGLKAAMDQYELFMQHNGFKKFLDQVSNKIDSEAAYGELQGVINGIQDIIDDAREYADAYIITNPDVETYQNTLNSIIAAIDARRVDGTVHSNRTVFEAELNICKNHAEQLNGLSNSLEWTELDSQIKHLRYEYNQAVAAGVVDAQNQQKYEDVINGYQDELGSIYGKEDIHAAFIALEGKIAASRNEITNLFNPSLIATLHDNLTSLADDVQYLCDANKKNLDENCHEPVQQRFAAELEAAAEKAAVAAGKIQTYWEAETLLFYSESLENTLTQLKNSLTTMAEAIEQAEAPYDVNDAACKRLQDELDGYVARYNALNKKLLNYKHCNYDWFQNDTRFKDYSQLDQERLEKAQKEFATDRNVMLSEDATLLYEHYEALLLDLDRTYSYYEAEWRVQDVYDKLAKAEKELEGYLYINKNEVHDAYRSIDKAYNSMLVFNDKSHGTVDGSGTIFADIDGNKFYNEWGVEVSKSISWAAYVSDCVPAVFERCEKLLGKVKEYSDLIMKSRYLIGDVNEDTKVLVDDYTTILRHTLHAAIITDPKLLAAADANFDGAVNIGDLTAVARIITGTDDVQPVAAPSRVRSIIAPSADALALRFEGEGLHQRIAVSVDASRLYAGAQMDIRLPEGITLSAATAGAGAEGFAVYTNALENGMHRVVLTSLEGLTFAENSDALLWLDVQVDHNYSGEGVEISNILFSDTMAHVYSLQAPAGEATGLGTVSMTEEVKEKIYSVGGILMDGLKRGVNIIRGNDGTSKKVIIK
ncbi:MAG: dockerin type I domain-containing protein [Bacteroidales bacterium]|nr:dockerin type I domain-containing protein [Bacteroidales bacterium]